MKIGELSQRTGCPIARIRFYEKKGLVPKPDRTMGNQRCTRLNVFVVFGSK